MILGPSWRTLCVAMIACAAGAAPAQPTPPRPAPADVPRVIDETKVVGAWRLVRSEMRTPDGKTFPSPNYGPDPSGYIMYDKSHTMCVFLAVSDAPSQAPPGFVMGRGDGPSERLPATYCGRWLLNADHTAIIHRVEVALDRRMVGDQLRKAWIDGDTLTIRSPLPRGLQDYYLQFERVAQ